MITNYMHMRQILANGGGSYKPLLWTEPQHPPYDKKSTVYSQVNPKSPTPPIRSNSIKPPSTPSASCDNAQKAARNYDL